MHIYLTTELQNAFKKRCNWKREIRYNSNPNNIFLKENHYLANIDCTPAYALFEWGMFVFETKPLFVAQASLEFMAILLSQPPGHRYDAIALLYNVYGIFTEMCTYSSTMSPPVLAYVSLGILGAFPSLAFWDLDKTVKRLGQEPNLYEENSIQVSL